MELSITREENPNGWLILTVHGEIDLATAPDLDAALQQAVTDGRRKIAVDLSPVTFMDSTGLRSLITLHRQLAEAEGRLIVIAPEGPARRLLEIAAVIDALDVVTSRDELRSTGDASSSAGD